MTKVRVSIASTRWTRNYFSLCFPNKKWGRVYWKWEVVGLDTKQGLCALPPHHWNSLPQDAEDAVVSCGLKKCHGKQIEGKPTGSPTAPLQLTCLSRILQHITSNKIWYHAVVFSHGFRCLYTNKALLATPADETELWLWCTYKSCNIKKHSIFMTSIFL